MIVAEIRRMENTLQTKAATANPTVRIMVVHIINQYWFTIFTIVKSKDAPPRISAAINFMLMSASIDSCVWFRSFLIAYAERIVDSSFIYLQLLRKMQVFTRLSVTVKSKSV